MMLAKALSPRLYVPGCRFIKAGVILVDLLPACAQQQELDLEPEQEPETPRERSRLMVAIVVIHHRHGKGAVHAVSTEQTAPQRA